MSPLLVLVGPPGAGKSTVAARLAELLDVDARDTDADVEAAAGTSVQEVFLDRGEAHFRALERDAVRAALDEHEGVLALGGGAVLDADTRAALADHRVVHLDVGLAQAVRRIGMGTTRPLLLGNVRSTLKRLLDERRPLYTEVASSSVDTDGLEPEAVVQQVLALLEAER